MKRALLIGLGLITIGFGAGMLVNATQDGAREKTKALVKKYQTTEVRVVTTDQNQKK